MTNEVLNFSEEAAGENQESNELFDAFEAAMAEGKEEDDVKLAMISAGASFKNVTRFYNQFMIESGRAISKADRDVIIENTIGALDLSTEESFGEAVAALSTALSCNENSAKATIRAYAKKNERPVFAAEKSDSKSRNPFVRLFHEALVDNPNFTEDDLKSLLASLEPEHQVNPLRWFSQHNNIRIMVNNIAKKYGVSAP